MVVEDAAFVGTRHNHQATVGFGHVVETDADGENVVVGVREERPVLMPLDGTAVCTRFHVQFVAYSADVRPDQLCENIQNAGVPHRFAVDWVLAGGLLDPAKLR
jgi:hypothetical protein